MRSLLSLRRDKKCYLVVGLGNPGKQYGETRHNIGFQVVKALGAKYKMAFKSSLMRTKGILGEGIFQGDRVRLLMPMTYMNQSGNAVKRCTTFYKIPAGDLMIVADDVDLPFGKLRLRLKGGAGGHNGLKSVEAYLDTQEYPRLRIGVGGPSEQEELADYVLGLFTLEEQKQLPEIVKRAVEAIELWMSEGIETAMQEVNRSH